MNSITANDVMGTYTKKFIVHSNELEQNVCDLIKAYGVKSIFLKSGKHDNLSEPDINYLKKVVHDEMIPKDSR